MWPWISPVKILTYFFKISMEKIGSSVRKRNTSVNTILMCWVRYLITSLKTYLTCMQCTLAVLILSSRLALQSADFRLLALQLSLHDRENSKAAVGLAFGHLSDKSKSLVVSRIKKHWRAPFLKAFYSAHLLGSVLSLMVYPHGTKPVPFKQLSTLVAQGFAAGPALMNLRQRKQESFLLLVRSCMLKQSTWNNIPQAVLFLFHETLILLV